MSTPVELQKRIAELEMRNRCAETIIAISTAMARAQSPTDVLSTLIDPVRDLINSAADEMVAASLIYVEPTEEGAAEWVQIRATWPDGVLHSDLVPGVRLPLDLLPKAQKWLLSLDTPRFVADVRADPEMNATASSFFLEHDIHALILMPLVRGSGWFGVLAISWDRPHQFSAEERYIYSALPPLLGPTIEVHQLINDLEDQVAARTTELMTFKLVLDESPAAVGMLNTENQFIYTNPSFNQVFGIEDTSSGLTAAAVLGDEAAALLITIPASAKFNEPITYRQQNGQTFTGQTVAFWLTTDPPRSQTYQTLIIEDVTERVQAEEILRQSLWQIQTIFDHMPAVIYVKDMAGRYIIANQQFCERANVSLQDVLGKTSDEVFPHIDFTDHLEQQVIDTGESLYIEQPGEITGRTYFAAKFLLYDEAGEPYAFCNTSIDITERIEAEKVAKQTLHQLQAIFDHIPAAIYVKDMAGRYMIVNQQFCERSSSSLQDVLGKTSDEAFPHLDYTDPFEKQVIETGESLYVEQVGNTTGKTYFAAKFLLYDEAGQPYAFCNTSIDITERKQVEEEVRQTRQQLQDMFDHTPVAVLAKGIDGRILFVNHEWADRVGLSRAEMVGRLESELLPDATYIDEKWYQQEFDVLQDPQPITREETGVVTGRHYLNTVFPLFDDKGDIYAICSSALDVTDRKRIEQEMQSARQQLQDMFDNIPAVVYAKDLTGRIIFANHEWCQRAEYDHQAVIGKLDADLFPEQDFVDGIWLPNELIVLESQQPFIFEETGIRSGCAYLTTLFPLRDPEGVIYALCSSSIDITERKQAEAEREELTAHVWEQAERVAHIISSVPEGVLLLDAFRRIILANPLATEDLKQVEGAEVGDVLHSFGDQPLDVLLTSPTEGLWHEVKVVVDETPRYLEVIARPIETSPVNAGWVLVWHDVTRERIIQRQIQQQERLAAVGQLAAGIAHDFNNIVAVIVLYAQIVRQTANLSPKADDRLQVIAEQAHRASNLIDQILDFSRRSVMERQPLDMAPFLKEQAKLLARIMPESIIINLQINPNNHTVNADLTRIQQTIMNLVVNARDAMPNGGNLDIVLDRIAVTADNAPLPDMVAGQWVMITIADTGTGIPADTLPHIFDPFFTTKELGEGTGLGLAQVHGIVHQHDGHIMVQTEPGNGTTFTIYLPSLVQQESATLLDGEQLVHGSGELILLVEDNTTTREAIVASLELLNYQVITAADGQQALEMWLKQRDAINLIVSDVVMPNMGGVALFHALQAYDPAVRVILLTGHVMEKNLEAQLATLKAQGLLNWLHKPADLPLLARSIAQALHE